ncbi:hypothetical protein D3C78_721360 [compost metagenome]
MAIHSLPISSQEGANRVTIISASWAPEATPSVVGDARGLRSTCCIRVPASPRAAPASRQTTSRGSQLKWMTAWRASSSLGEKSACHQREPGSWRASSPQASARVSASRQRPGRSKGEETKGFIGLLP